MCHHVRVYCGMLLGHLQLTGIALRHVAMLIGVGDTVHVATRLCTQGNISDRAWHAFSAMRGIEELEEGIGVFAAFVQRWIERRRPEHRADVREPPRYGFACFISSMRHDNHLPFLHRACGFWAR